MKKRFITFVLVTVLAAGLAACGGGAGGGKGQTPPETAGNATAKEDVSQSEQGQGEQGQGEQRPEEQGQGEQSPGEQSQTETEALTPAGPTEEEISSAYLQILRRDEARIRAYNWQDNWGNGGEGRQIAIHDVNGDAIPELIYIMIPKDKNGAMYMGDLHIYTYEADEKEAEELYDQESWDVAVAGGSRYCLFLGEDGSFYAYKSFGDDHWTNTFSRFAMKGSDDMVLTTQMERFDHWNESDTDRVQEYTGAGDEEITEEDYENGRLSLAEKMAVCLMQGNLDDKDLQRAAERVGDVSMSYDEAVRYLQGKGAKKEAENVQASTLFAALEDLDFYFSSGVGGWATELEIDEDGSFSGAYHDSDMGDAGNTYPHGTVYTCEFEGRFSAPEKLDDYSYRMKLESIQYEKKPGETWIDDGVRMIAADAYGLEKSEGGDFIVYLPGAPTKDLPQEFLDWLRMPRAWDTVPDTLPLYGLYNVTTKEGFSAEGSAAGQTETAGFGLQGLLPESSQRLLTTADLAGMSNDDIQLAINTIYARHGYRFKDSELLAYFSGFDWYQPSYSDMETVKDMFSDIEEDNVDFLAGQMK